MHSKYQEWQGSRWDYTKSRSSWHFDPTVKNQEDFTQVCRFDGNWSDEIIKYSNLVEDAKWSTRNFEIDRIYSASEEEADLIRAGADPDMKIFQRTKAEDSPVFRRIADYFGMEDTAIKFHNQITGQMLVWHIDNFAGREERQNSFLTIDADNDPNTMRRFIIALDNWKHGQVFALGNSYWHQWKKGDCITWEWQEMPHATCNMGWDPRPILQITGKTTERTRQIMSNANPNNIVKI